MKIMQACVLKGKNDPIKGAMYVKGGKILDLAVLSQEFKTPKGYSRTLKSLKTKFHLNSRISLKHQTL